MYIADLIRYDYPFNFNNLKGNILKNRESNKCFHFFVFLISI